MRKSSPRAAGLVRKGSPSAQRSSSACHTTERATDRTAHKRTKPVAKPRPPTHIVAPRPTKVPNAAPNAAPKAASNAAPKAAAPSAASSAARPKLQEARGPSAAASPVEFEFEFESEFESEFEGLTDVCALCGTLCGVRTGPSTHASSTHASSTLPSSMLPSSMLRCDGCGVLYCCREHRAEARSRGHNLSCGQGLPTRQVRPRTVYVYHGLCTTDCVLLHVYYTDSWTMCTHVCTHSHMCACVVYAMCASR